MNHWIVALAGWWFDVLLWMWHCWCRLRMVTLMMKTR